MYEADAPPAAGIDSRRCRSASLTGRMNDCSLGCTSGQPARLFAAGRPSTCLSAAHLPSTPTRASPRPLAREVSHMAFTPKPWPRTLRSQEWCGGTSRDNIYHRGWMKNQGFPHDLFDGRPVIGICNTWSRADPLQRPPARPGRAGEARRLRGRRLPGRVPGLLGVGERLPPDGDDVPQPRRHGRRGGDPRPTRSTGWCCSSAATRPRRRC